MQTIRRGRAIRIKIQNTPNHLFDKTYLFWRITHSSPLYAHFISSARHSRMWKIEFFSILLSDKVELEVIYDEGNSVIMS